MSVYLKQDLLGFVGLWGIATLDADNISAEDQEHLDSHGRCLTMLWERAGDDGMFWRRTYVLIDLDAVWMRFDGSTAHIQLPGGSWLVMENVPISLHAEAAAFGLLEREAQPAETALAQRWSDVQARAMLFEKGILGTRPDDTDPYWI
jgi:hypothetical protein